MDKVASEHQLELAAELLARGFEQSQQQQRDAGRREGFNPGAGDEAHTRPRRVSLDTAPQQQPQVSQPQQQQARPLTLAEAFALAAGLAPQQRPAGGAPSASAALARSQSLSASVARGTPSATAPPGGAPRSRGARSGGVQGDAGALHPALRLGWQPLCEVVCNGLTGQFLGGHHLELYIRCTGTEYGGLPLIDSSLGGCIMTCSQFERAAGRELSKKWKESLHVVGEGDGSRATLASWLKRQAEARFGGAAAVGRQLWVLRIGEGDYRAATVLGYSKDSGKHAVQYAPSGTAEELHLPAELVSFEAVKPLLPPPGASDALAAAAAAAAGTRSEGGTRAAAAAAAPPLMRAAAGSGAHWHLALTPEPPAAAAAAGKQQSQQQQQQQQQAGGRGGGAAASAPVPGATAAILDDYRPANLLWHQSSGISVSSSYADEAGAGGGMLLRASSAAAAALAAAVAAASAAAGGPQGGSAGRKQQRLLERVPEAAAERQQQQQLEPPAKRSRAAAARSMEGAQPATPPVQRQARSGAAACSALAAARSALAAAAAAGGALSQPLAAAATAGADAAAAGVQPAGPPPGGLEGANLSAMSAWMHTLALQLDPELQAAAAAAAAAVPAAPTTSGTGATAPAAPSTGGAACQGGSSACGRFQTLLALARREEGLLQGLYEAMLLRYRHFERAPPQLLRAKLVELMLSALQESAAQGAFAPTAPREASPSGGAAAARQAETAASPHHPQQQQQQQQQQQRAQQQQQQHASISVRNWEG